MLVLILMSNYDLGRVGRDVLNSKLFISDYYIHQSCLVPEDVLGVLNYLMRLENGFEVVDDIDDLKNKRIRGSGELLLNHLSLGFSDVLKAIKLKLDYLSEKLGENVSLLEVNELIDSRVFSNLLKKFFLNNQLSQILEDLNPLAEISHKRKICSFGVGAIDRTRASMKIREIHSSHFGRICPIETSEGKNAGLILSLAKDAIINDLGFIESPFYL